MTNNMERIKFEVVRAIVTCFPKDYIEIGFWSEACRKKEFVDEIIVEFIKYAFDNSQEKHSLRYYVPYGVDENNDGRMLYTRLLKYCQKYRIRNMKNSNGKVRILRSLKLKVCKRWMKKGRLFDYSNAIF